MIFVCLRVVVDFFPLRPAITLLYLTALWIKFTQAGGDNRLRKQKALFSQDT